MRYLTIIIICLITSNLLGQSNLLYHQYEQTASSYKILRWNIPTDSSSFYKWCLRETYDNKRRVTRLDFLENGNLIKDRLCYLPDYVVYKYLNDSTIVEELYNADNSPLNGIECVVPYKRIFTIDKDFNIVNLKIDYYVDSAGYSSRDIKIELNYINKIRDQVSKGIFDEFNCLSIQYYFKSFMKYDHRFPIKKDFNRAWIQSNDLEDKEANRCLIK